MNQYSDLKSMPKYDDWHHKFTGILIAHDVHQLLQPGYKILDPHTEEEEYKLHIIKSTYLWCVFWLALCDQNLFLK